MKDLVIIAGKIRVDPEKRDGVLEHGAQLMRDTRTQKGCLDYNWSADSLTPGRIYVYERWESQGDLAAHFDGPHYLAMRDTIAAHGLRGADVSKYLPELSEPVYDPQGRPRADFYTRSEG